MNREQRRSQLSGKAPQPAQEFSLNADIMYNKEGGRVTIVYSRTINNVSYTPNQLENHIRGLAVAGRMIKPDFMPEIKA